MIPTSDPLIEAARARDVLSSARRILVVRTDDLGDNILAGSFPGLLAGSVTGRCGYVGPPAALELIPTERLDFVEAVDCRPRGYVDVLRAGYFLGAAMRRFRPDVVVLPRFDFEREALGIACALSLPRSTITWPVGATAKRRRRSWWLTALPGPRLPDRGVPVHEWDRLKAFATMLGLDASQLKPALAPAVVEAPLTIPGLDASSPPIVIFAIGAAKGKRIWPLERFGALAQHMGQADLLPVLVGSPSEAGFASTVVAAADGVPMLNLVGQLPLRSTAALLARAQLFVGNDSGLGHIAAAAGTPTVTISCHPCGAPADHINSTERYHPVGNRSTAVRPPRPARARCTEGCTSRDTPCCIALISVDAVMDACLSLRAALGGGQ